MCKPGGCLNVILRRNSMGDPRRAALLEQLNSSAAFRAVASTRRLGLLLVQPPPPQWLRESLQSSVLTPPLETRGAAGTVFALGELAPRVGDGRRAKQLEL